MMDDALTREKTSLLQLAFKGLEENELQEMAKLSKFCTHPAGTILCHEGEYEDFLYIVADGTVVISCLSMTGAEAAREMVERVAEDVKIGKIYTGRVTSIKDFGAFIEVVPGQDGLCHISELAAEYVRSVNEVCKIGDTLKVKVISIDEQGRVKLSRKAAILEEGDEGDGKPAQPAKRRPND